jgi:ATP-dependent DNA helicase RecG
MIHPEYRITGKKQITATNESLTPIYPATKGIQQGRLRNLTDQALQSMREAPPKELLPEEITKKFDFISLASAINFLHRPPPETNLNEIISGTHPFQQRLVFEELLAHYLSLRNLRSLTAAENAIALSDGGKNVKNFINELPFKLTNAQKSVTENILSDLEKPQPMMRLLQGDVGSGKTIVAGIACLKAIVNGAQAAIMAPTEILAEQHWRSFSEWFQPLGIRAAWLSGSQRVASRRESLELISSGNAKLIIGTHALFQEGINFKNLGLVVIDEQHRFGVHQRMAFRNKGISKKNRPHQLVMTATPIPRTLAMAAYADLDTSVIDELPPNRQPISTIAIPETRRSEVIKRVESSCSKGQQAYWVCPLIEESDSLNCQAAEASYLMLTEILPKLRIGIVHGRMKPLEKERVMKDFKKGHIQLLVATTVIEVGVDVPNASLMIIENAERMGLSQLHQLRGRVGRGKMQSHCVLLYKLPLGKISKERLSVLRNTNDGFIVAQRDLELRGPGELLGAKQKGLPEYRVADIGRDAYLMPQVQIAADMILEKPKNYSSEIIRRWLGDAGRYGKV